MWTRFSSGSLLPGRLRRLRTQQMLLAVSHAGCLVLLLVLWRSGGGGPRSSTLDRVVASRLLRVGVTGDYLPFALRCAGARDDVAGSGVVGSDVDEAIALADSLGARPQIVLSTWAEITDDLALDRFDIGVGGISPTLQRRRSAAFTASYALDGKVLVARCGSPLLDAAARGWDALRGLRSLSLAINPGGTNELTARDELPHAHLSLVAANGEQFGLVASGAVNGTLTDSIEATLEHLRTPQLCHSELLTEGSKAYLLPRDDFAWTAYVDAWLAPRVRSGAANASLQRWLLRGSALGEGHLPECEALLTVQQPTERRTRV